MEQTQDKKVLKLVSPMPVSVNHYLGWRAIIKKLPNGKSVPMAVSYETAEAKKYKREFIPYIKKEVKKQNWQMSDDKFQKYYLDAIFYFPRIDMDSNNYWKLLADSITESESVWIDDTQLCERVQGIFYDSKNPRIEAIIHPVNYIGVFKDASQLEQFESNCIECSRYNRNCSLLKNAKTGHIQGEIKEINSCFNCEKFKQSKN